MSSLAILSVAWPCRQGAMRDGCRQLGDSFVFLALLKMPWTACAARGPKGIEHFLYSDMTPPLMAMTSLGL